MAKKSHGMMGMKPGSSFHSRRMAARIPGMGADNGLHHSIKTSNKKPSAAKNTIESRW